MGDVAALGHELSGVLALDPGTLSPLLKRLEAAGWWPRRDPGDERTLAVDAHRRGPGAAPRGRADPAGVVERLGMPLADLERLHAVLSDVIAATRTAPENAGA